MYPILFQIGPVIIYSLWIFITIGFFVALLIMLKLIKKNRLKLQFLADSSLAIFLGGIILSRLIFVIQNYQTYLFPFNYNNVIQIFYIWDKGMSLWGGIIGCLGTLVYLARKEKENALRWLDVFTVGITGGFVFGNIGTFLDGTNYGNETTLPWGVVMDNSIYAVPIHPVQIYSAIYCLVIAIILYLLFSRNVGKKDGNIMLLGSGLYSLLYFCEGFLRGDESNIFIGLREEQIYALLIFLISGILFYAKNFTNFNIHNLKHPNQTEDESST
ncbi:prolipoprotein diacylglyceryl transferase [Candidatus Gracilibacteria bacterium]|nr:prolipoprotein diacylglyceryl transferase [Candidatus Gracilibacteria bacterium]